jgi:hypothetical protein
MIRLYMWTRREAHQLLFLKKLPHLCLYNKNHAIRRLFRLDGYCCHAVSLCSKYLLMLGNDFAGSENIAESRFAAALPIITLLSNVEVAISNNIQNFHLPPRCFWNF